MRIKINILLSLILSCVFLAFTGQLLASNFYWRAAPGKCCRVLVTPPYSTSTAICEAGAISFTYSFTSEEYPVLYVWTGIEHTWSGIYKKNEAAIYKCLYTKVVGRDHLPDQTMEVMRVGSSCPQGTYESDDGTLCIPELPSLKNSGSSCEKEDLFKGNPINIAIGNKYQMEHDFYAGGGLPLRVTRSFNSSINSWRFFSSIENSTAGARVNVISSDGKGLAFNKEGGVWVSELDVVETLTATEDSQGTIINWTYTRRDDLVETYDIRGRIVSVTNRSGISHTYSYQTDSITVTHTNGDALVYHLDSEGRVSGFTDPDNRAYQYGYDATGRLVSVTYPDDTPADTTDNPKRVYHYEDNNFPHALTGITDENGNRYATWTYDSEGRAISSEHANGVDKTTLTYNADGTTTVTNPLGKQTTYHFTTIQGVRKVTQVEGHPTASCEGANKSYSYDANGNVTSKTDWNGVTTTYTYDMDRNLELSRTEASGTPQARTITTEWHPQFRLPTKITESNKITEYSYDAQGRQLSSKVSSVQ